ncbi:MAG: DinB family protein [Saprospiraceae bacterium]|nr:DinB family protein [Saprospiraceae bacterium]
MNIEKYTATLQAILYQTRKGFCNIPRYVLTYKTSAVKWSKREILGHLIDSARYNLMRFTEIHCHDDIYEIKGYHQDHLVNINQYQTLEDHHLLTLWQLLNDQIIMVISAFTNDDLAKSIKVKGEIKTVAWLIEDYINHLQHHLNQIFADDLILEKTPVKVSLAEAIDALLKSATLPNPHFVEVLQYADMEVEFYKPDGNDLQKPHLKDEVYVIISGHGNFYVNGHILPFRANDILFVKAGDEHRFIDFTDDFSTWVIFYGVRNGIIR